MSEQMICQAVTVDENRIREIVDPAYHRHSTSLVSANLRDQCLTDYTRRIADGQVWVVGVADRIVGILVLEDDGDKFLLDNIAVAPDQQGKGVGRVLLEFAEAEAVRRGWSEIVLYTHALMTENIALYRRIGYVGIGSHH